MSDTELIDELNDAEREIDRLRAALATAETGELKNALAVGQVCIELSEERKEVDRLRAALSERDRMLGEAAKEAVIAWSVCASIHREYGKGHDALFSTRQGDFQKHEDTARAFLAAYDASKREKV